MTVPKGGAVMPARRYYASGIAAAEAGMARKDTYLGSFTPSNMAGRMDRDNFVSNRVTLQDYDDSRASGATSALGLSAVWACVNLIAGTIGTLPIMVYRSVAGGVEEEEWDHQLYRLIAESPNADQTPVDYFEFCAASVELHGNSYSEIERGAGGRIVALSPPITPDLMTVRRAAGGEIEYKWMESGKTRIVGQDRMLHIRGFGGSPLGGLSTLSFGRQTFGMAHSIDRAAAATFRNGIRASGLLEMPDTLTPEQRSEAEALLQQKYQGTMNAGLPMLLDRGVKWQSIAINPEDAQMLESRGWSVEEICRFFGTPPHMIGHTAGNTQLGSSIEQQTLAFLIFSLRRRLRRFEQGMAKQLLTPADRSRGLKIKFDIRGLMRGDSKARAEFYQMALQNGWMTINEVRSLEGLPPVDGGDIIRMQMQNVPISSLMGHNGGPPLGE